MENYCIVLKVNLQNCKHFEQRFSLQPNGEQTSLPELFLVSETSNMSSTISVRIGTVVRYSFFLSDRCETDLTTVVKIHATNLI